MDKGLAVKAAKYAIDKHASVNQMYGSFPYSKHLGDVAGYVMKYHDLIPTNDVYTVVSGAWCHDLIEDVHSVTYNDIKQDLGEDIADLAYACTESTGRNRAERHDWIYFERIKSVKYADMIKVADWLANVSEGIRTGSSMLKKYKAEYMNFRDQLYNTRYYLMWEELDSLLLDGESKEGSNS